jgi:hypothetical protein
MGSASHVGSQTNIEIYGNFISDWTDNIDWKDGTVSADVHHNIIEKRVLQGSRPATLDGGGDDGNLRSGGTKSFNNSSGNKFHRNIVRDMDAGGCCGVIWLDHNRVDIFENVFYDLRNQSSLIYRKASSPPENNPPSNTQINNNIFCNTPTKRPSGSYSFSGNQLNQPKSRIVKIFECVDLPAVTSPA